MIFAGDRKVVIFIVGPTATGKTRLAIKLARRIRGEIISSDSMQVYKGIEILSQAPRACDRKKVRHHLVGALSPGKEYNVAIFKRMATRLIRAMIVKKKAPIVVGGSGLYIKGLIDGLFSSPEADIDFRNRMEGLARRYGSKKLHDRLRKIDPDAAFGIHPNDTRRIIRALEIHHSTGKTMTELKVQTEGLRDKYEIKIFGLIMPREKLYSNINVRVDEMFRHGVVDEVERLCGKIFSRTMKAVLGFKEILGYLNGEYDLTEVKELIKMNTRRFAKRQLTWFRQDKRIIWFDKSVMNEDEIVCVILKALSKKV